MFICFYCLVQRKHAFQMSLLIVYNQESFPQEARKLLLIRNLTRYCMLSIVLRFGSGKLAWEFQFHYCKWNSKWWEINTVTFATIVLCRQMYFDMRAKKCLSRHLKSHSECRYNSLLTVIGSRYYRQVLMMY